MAKKKQKKKKKMPEQVQRPKDFLDMIAPAAIKFNTDHFILGSRYHTAMALKSYPPMTDELALLRGLGDMGGVNLRLTARQVTPAEEDTILHAATNKSRMERSNTNDYKQSVTAEANLRDMAELLAKQRQEKEPLIHCGVYLDIAATDTEKLRAARDTVSAQLVRSRMGADPLLLRQREGFLSANPAGGSQLANFAERVLPARSVANLYPMNYSGKTDPEGFFIGRDRFGSNIIVDFDRRASDKTNASALILGNTGQGKSYLLKLLLCNVREAGKSVISLDSEHEMEDECRALGGCFLDYLSGQYRINLLEPRCWDDGSGPEDPDAPDAFRGTLLSQHISFLRDVFRVYKGFDTPHIDTLELMVEQLYKKWGITDRTALPECSRPITPSSPTSMTPFRKAMTITMVQTASTRGRCCGICCWDSIPCAAARMLASSTGIPILTAPNSLFFVSRDWITWRKICGTPCCSACCPICRISF